MAEAESRDSYTSILKYTGLFGGVQGLGILMGIVRNKLVAVILGPDGMGLISLFNSTIKLVSDSTRTGLPMSAVKSVSEAEAAGQHEATAHTVAVIRTWTLLTSLAGMVLCILLSPLLNKWTFSWGNHTLHFVMLSPVVLLTGITAGETAVLKGARQLRHLAAISLYGVAAALLSSAPLYWLWGQKAIVPSLVLMALMQAVITVAYSYRLFPLRAADIKTTARESMPMVRLGTAFMAAGILGSGAEFLIRSFLNNAGDLQAVGLYNAGYMMTMTYAGLVFQAMETDYFPRLSAEKSLGTEFNNTVNRQIEVTLLLIAPLLAVFITALPVLLPALYSGRFTPAADMMRLTIPAMLLRAITLPIEYIPLARGDSKSYLLLETIYDVMIALLVPAGFRWLGLTGTGAALATAAVVNTVVVTVYARYKYGFTLSADVAKAMAAELPLGVMAAVITMTATGWTYWLPATAVCAVITVLSLKVLHSKTHLWNKMTQRLRTKINYRKGKK